MSRARSVILSEARARCAGDGPSRRTPITTVQRPASDPEGYVQELFRTFLRSFLATTAAALREIFDEAAYARFLARTRQPSSRAAYAGFLRERAASQERRARCC